MGLYYVELYGVQKFNYIFLYQYIVNNNNIRIVFPLLDHKSNMG